MAEPPDVPAGGLLPGAPLRLTAAPVAEPRTAELSALAALVRGQGGEGISRATAAQPARNTAAAAADLAAVHAFGDALAGTGKSLVGTSGTLALARLGRPGTEEDAGAPGGRIDAEDAVIGFAERGVRSSAVRIPMREIAGSIGGHLGIPTASIPGDQLGAHFGFLAALIALDSPATSLVTRRVLGWEPVHPGLLADFDDGDYFTAPPPRR